MAINCLIVDDEPLACGIIEEYLLRLEGYRIAGICHNAVEAFNILKQQPIDLIFLDIQMPRLTGIEFLKSLKHPPLVILTTAYSDYALEGFELDVADYLLKPIAFERFLRAIDKASRMLNPGMPNQNPTSPDAFIYVKEDKITQKVYLSEILFLESQGNYVKIVCQNRQIIAYTSLTLLEETLPASHFFRVHRGFMVAFDKITAFSGGYILIDKHQVPIGRNYRSAVDKRLNP